MIDESGTIEQGVKQYLHQLYVLGYKPTIVEEIFIGDASLLKRVRQSVAVTINSSAKTITASSGTPFSGYVSGMRVLIENSSNYGEYTVVTASSTILTVSESIANESATITISTLKDSGNYRGVSVEFIYNIDMTMNGKVSNLYPYQTTQAALNLPCRSGTPQYYTTPDNVNEAILELGFMSGLVSINKDNDLKNKSVTYKIEYRQVDTTTWNTAVNNTITANVREAYRFTKTIHFPTVGQYEIRVTKTSSDSTSSMVMDRLTWNSVTTHAMTASGDYKSPVAEDTADDILLMALKIEASEQLTGTISDLSVVETRWVNDYDVSTDSWILRDTQPM